MKIILFLLIMFASTSGYSSDEGCELYLCLKGTSEGDGGATCSNAIAAHKNKMTNACVDLPSCYGSSGERVMSTTMAVGGSADGSIAQGCVNLDTTPPTCSVGLYAPATTIFRVALGECGG